MAAVPRFEERHGLRVHHPRYLVIPRRPEGTEGMGAEALAQLVTRDSMIGTGLASAPR